MLAARCARRRRTRTSSAATCSCPGLRSSPHPRRRHQGRPAPTRSSSRSSRPRSCTRKTGYSRPHTVHCGPDGIYMSALGAPDGDGPGGIFLLDHDDFEPLGRWEIDRGPQYLAYDFWWHLGHDTLLTSEWGTPNMVEDGLDPRAAARQQVRPPAARLGPAASAATCRRSTSAPSTRWCSSCGPAHDPTQALRLRRRRRLDRRPQRVGLALAPRGDDGSVGVEKVITIPAEPAETDQLPPALQPFGAVPPLVTDIALQRRRPAPVRVLLGHRRAQALRRLRPAPPEARPARCASAASSRARRTRRAGALNGGPQMVEVSRDGKRVYLTNSLYAAWDAQFYPEGIDGWMVKLDAETAALDARPGLLRRVRRRAPAPGPPRRAATPRPTRTASRRDARRPRPLADPGRARRLPRRQPGHGLAVRRVARACRSAAGAPCCASLLPIAIGHEAVDRARGRARRSALRSSTDPSALRIVAAAVAVRASAIFRFVKPRAHFRWTSMRVSDRELTLWSFLMSTAHGAGLMVAPVLLGLQALADAGRADPRPRRRSALRSLARRRRGRLALHVGAMLAVMGVDRACSSTSARAAGPAPRVAEHRPLWAGGVRPRRVHHAARLSGSGRSVRGRAHRRLRRRDPRDRHPVTGARDVVDARVVEELDRVGVAAVLAADAELEVGLASCARATRPCAASARRPACRSSRTASGRRSCGRCTREDLALDVVAARSRAPVCVRSFVPNEKKSACVGDPVGDEARARQLDHRADRVVARRRDALALARRARRARA